MATSSRRIVAAFTVIAAATGCARAPCQVLITQEEALRLAFPDAATTDRRTAFLSRADLETARRLAGSEGGIDRSVVTYYVGRRASGGSGVAYFDAHRVRTLQEVLMIVLDDAGRVARIEVLGFAEPPEYMPPEGWLALFQGHALDAGGTGKSNVPAITGATLTSGAVGAAIRRVQALHAVIDPFGTHADVSP